MIINLEQAKQIVDFFPTIPDVINVFDTNIADDDEGNVTSIEFLFQSGNMNDDDTVKEFMVNTLGISEDSFDTHWEMIHGDSWMYLAIH